MARLCVRFHVWVIRPYNPGTAQGGGVVSVKEHAPSGPYLFEGCSQLDEIPRDPTGFLKSPHPRRLARHPPPHSQMPKVPQVGEGS